MNPPQFDSERLTFLRALDAAAAEGIEVTDWEANFLHNAFKFQSTAPAFSDRQRERIREMWDRYAPRMKHPMGTLAASGTRGTRVLPETTPGKCAWLLTREGQTQQSRCNEPNAAGSNFCPKHTEERVRAKLQAAKARRI